jgi:bifunctional isochorismate lyase / aryl carrier protein
MVNPQYKFKDYALPALSELPPNKVDWKVDADHAALLVHDMQLYFLRFFSPQSKVCELLLNNIEALINVAREKGMKIYYTAQPGDMASHRGLLMDIWGPGMSKQSADQSIHSQIAPQPDDTVLTKWRYSAFYDTELREDLARNNISQLIITGVFAHIGCLASGIDAYSGDIKVFMPVDALADFDKERHLMATSYAAANCASVTDTKSLIKSLSAIRTI